MNYSMTLPIGDWSQDGHNMVENIVVTSNIPPAILRTAYLASCDLTGYQFHSQAPYNYPWNQNGPRKTGTPLLVEYQDYQIPLHAIEDLEEHGLNFHELMHENSYEDGCEACPTPRDLVHILMAFIALSIDDELLGEDGQFEWEIVNGPPPLFGFWNADLNVSMGYGLFE